MSRILFKQISRYCDPAKLTHKSHHHSLFSTIVVGRWKGRMTSSLMSSVHDWDSHGHCPHGSAFPDLLRAWSGVLLLVQEKSTSLLSSERESAQNSLPRRLLRHEEVAHWLSLCFWKLWHREPVNLMNSSPLAALPFLSFPTALSLTAHSGFPCLGLDHSFTFVSESSLLPQHLGFLNLKAIH